MRLAERIRANSEYTRDGFFVAQLANICPRPAADAQPRARLHPAPPTAAGGHDNSDIVIRSWVFGDLWCSARTVRIHRISFSRAFSRFALIAGETPAIPPETLQKI